MASPALRAVDHTGLKTGMALTILLLILAYVLNSPWLVAIVAFAQLFGALNLPFAPYRLIYHYLVKPSGIVKPHIITDNPEPHRFSLLVGALFNIAATISLAMGQSLVGWLLVGAVVLLANLNFWLNFCVGCWIYYLFNRVGVPGFTVTPLSK